jgi:hypothetical protein
LLALPGHSIGEIIDGVLYTYRGQPGRIVWRKPDSRSNSGHCSGKAVVDPAVGGIRLAHFAAITFSLTEL